MRRLNFWIHVTGTIVAITAMALAALGVVLFTGHDIRITNRGADVIEGPPLSQIYFTYIYPDAGADVFAEPDADSEAVKHLAQGARIPVMAAAGTSWKQLVDPHTTVPLAEYVAGHAVSIAKPGTSEIEAFPAGAYARFLPAAGPGVTFRMDARSACGEGAAGCVISDEPGVIHLNPRSLPRRAEEAVKKTVLHEYMHVLQDRWAAEDDSGARFVRLLETGAEPSADCGAWLLGASQQLGGGYIAPAQCTGDGQPWTDLATDIIHDQVPGFRVHPITAGGDE